MEMTRAKYPERGNGEAITSARLRLRDLILDLLGEREDMATCVEGLTLVRRVTPVMPTLYVYRPSLAMIMQGRKSVDLAGTAYSYDEAHFMLTAVDLPTITEVTEASLDKPYVSILLELDLDTAKDMATRIDMGGRSAPPASGLSVGPVDLPMMEAMARLVALAGQPADAPYLSGPIQQELIYRLLTDPIGSQLREIVRANTQTGRIAQAITWLREHYREPLHVGELAALCGMGPSTLYQHFRTVTGTSPLQYQKQLRLHEARRLLIGGDTDVASAAFAVGYESAAQFNREYKRVFGASPRRETRRLLVAT